nr:hypothetical protein [Tanacetum cinerariifolium]
MPSFNSIVRAFASLGHDLGNSYVYDPNPNSFDCPPDSYHPPHPTYETYSYDSYGHDSQFGYDCQPHESEGIPNHRCDVPYHDNSPHLDVSKDQFEDFSESNDEFSSTDDDSFSFDKIDYVEASPPDYKLVSSEVIEIVILEVGGIEASNDNPILFYDPIISRTPLTLTPSRESDFFLERGDMLLLEAFLNDDHSSDCKTKSSSTSLNSLLEETNTFDNSLPEFETFCFDVEEISSGSTTIHPDISLPEYEAFYDDHVKEISSSSLTTHSDSSLYASFIFDLSINPFPPADRSDFYEFTDERIPFISPPEYDCFLFKVEPNSRDFTKDVVEDISPMKEPQVLIAPHYLLSLKNEDAIFDPGICNSNLSRPDISHRCGTVKKFNTHRSHLNACPMVIDGQNNPILDVLLFYFYPP